MSNRQTIKTAVSLAFITTVVVCLQASFTSAETGRNTRLSQCGGDVNADADSLQFPAADETLQAGDICVWTIHLETQTNFRFMVQNLSIGSNYTDCRDGGVRFYSLTNLSPAGQPESTTYCDILPPPPVFLLPNSIVVVVLYIGTGNTDPGRGFNISWTGMNADPMRTKHMSTFTTAVQGVVKYPVVEHYEPNLAATWLVKTVSPQQTTRSDFRLDNLLFETCSSSTNQCICDALILYEITEGGVLNETERFCGERTSAFFSNIESRFIIAFFTDFETQAGIEGGFEVTYYPTNEVTTTPTTTTTTTTTSGPTPETPCGGIFSETVSGRINYKNEQLYQPNERCVWTIRVQNALGMTFTLIQSGISGSDPDDGISISTFTRADPPLLKTEFMRFEGIPVTMNGSVAIVTFVTDSSMEGMGFVLEYRATGFSGGNISALSTDFISTTPIGFLDHPEVGNYDNNELSTFVVTTPGFSVNNSPRVNVTWTVKGLESSCYDYVVVFKFYPDPNSFGGWSQYDLYCATSPKMTSHTDMLLYVFKSDYTGNSTGFRLDWSG